MNYIDKELKAVPNADPELVARFLSHVDLIDDFDSCWRWTAATDKQGYGIFSASAKHTLRAPRAAWILFKSELPDVLKVLHDCDCTSCVRPTHLKAATQLDNMHDAAKRNRMTHGSAHHCSKLTPEKVAIIRTLFKTGVSKQKELAVMFKVSAATISQLITNKAWKEPTPINPEPVPVGMIPVVLETDKAA